MTPDAMAASTNTPSKSTFPGDRKTRNAAHSRVYRLLKKNRTEALAEEVAELRAEIDKFMAAYALSSSVLSEMADDIGQRYSARMDVVGGELSVGVGKPPPEEQGVGGVQEETTRKERKALAAKAARKRARDRLASLEHQVSGLRQWAGELRSLSEAQQTTGADATTPCAALGGAPSILPPPKKRHRRDGEFAAVMIEDID